MKRFFLSFCCKERKNHGKLNGNMSRKAPFIHIFSRMDFKKKLLQFVKMMLKLKRANKPVLFLPAMKI